MKTMKYFILRIKFGLFWACEKTPVEFFFVLRFLFKSAKSPLYFILMIRVFFWILVFIRKCKNPPPFLIYFYEFFWYVFFSDEEHQRNFLFVFWTGSVWWWCRGWSDVTTWSFFLRIGGGLTSHGFFGVFSFKILLMYLAGRIIH